MKKVDIMDAVTQGIEKIIYENWHHEGFIDGFNSEQVAFEVDGSLYVLDLKEVGDGE